MKRQIAFATTFALLCMPILDRVSAAPVEQETDKFAIWLAEFKKEAVQQGIQQSIADEALEGIKFLPKVIELDRKQPEFTMTFEKYMSNVVPKARIVKGRNKMAENRELLAAVSQKYGVQERYIVALWGVETDFGEKTGTYYIPEALATLAYDGRRSSFFRKELINSLKIANDGHIKPRELKGSWAGAMGQTQFMPSSYLSYAQDYDGDGRKDIWTTRADAFASIANYLKNVGWDKDQTWGRKVKLPENFSEEWIKKDKTLAEWQQLGVRNSDGSDLPQKGLVAMLSMPGGKSGEAFLVYENYKRILKWNRSDYFATAVGQLSDALR